MKVRLGRIIKGEQKGVDALIYRDLMTLARERAISCAYLVSGDEDLREGVVAAQDMGVQVVLMGIPGSRPNQSAALIREADDHVVLPKHHWDEHFSPAGTDGGPTTQITPDPAAAHTAGRAFAVEWGEKASGSELETLLECEPRIPRELDAALLSDAEKIVGSLPESEQEIRRELRAGFWAAIKDAKQALALPSG